MVEQTSTQTNKYTGSCLCGSVTITLDGSPLKTMACHCTDCQKSSGGPYQTNAMYSSSSVSVNDSEKFVKVYIVPKQKTGSGVEKQKWFCGNCGCTLFTRPMKYNGEKSVVKTGILDTPAGYTVLSLDLLKPASELYVKDRASFVHPIEGAKQFNAAAQ